LDKSALVKAIKQQKQEQMNLLNAISSGLISSMALEVTSNKLNSISDKIKVLETQVYDSSNPKQYRILTYDYFKQLCHNGSRLLTNSYLAEKRAFVEKYIESVTLDPMVNFQHLMTILPFVQLLFYQHVHILSKLV
jgi:hypothetical protein